MTKELGVIVPYFGPLPATFSVWIKSLEIAENVEYFLVTDQEVPTHQVSSLRIVNMTFVSLQRRVRDILGVNLHSPYKLCDLKPAYGYLFSELLSGFSYWAYCDLDLVFGDVKDLLDKIKKDKIHKVFSKGHFSIYQNTSEINEIFKIKRHHNKWNYIKNSKVIWVFDENYYGEIIGINGLFLSEGKKLLEDVALYADIDPNYRGFLNLNREGENCFFYLKKNRLIEVSYNRKVDRFYERVIVYAHYQKRIIKIVDAQEGALIYPDYWEEISTVSQGRKLLKQNLESDIEVKEGLLLMRTKKRINKSIKLLCESYRIDLITIIYSKFRSIVFRLK